MSKKTPTKKKTKKKPVEKLTPDHLRAFREKKGITQEQLGVMLGYSEKPGGRAIRAVELGERGIRGPTEKCFRYLEKYGPLR